MEAKKDKDMGKGGGNAPNTNQGDPDEMLLEDPEFAARIRRLFKGMKGDKPPYPGHRVLGDFRIIREIGSGGMGTVYEAEQLSLKRRVALKILPPPLGMSAKAVNKFRREAEAGGRQNHPGIVAIHAMGEHEGIHYIAQELVEGGKTLADELEERRKTGDLPGDYFQKTAKLIAEVADALRHAHASDVIHRDIKPSNILLTRDGRPKVADFGLAKVKDALALSQTGELLGTPYYMSPEQAMIRRDEIDHRTDVYSLGVTLYEALTQKRPFDGETSQEVLKKILLQEPRDPRKVDPAVPRELAVICLKAMEKNPKRRYQTMEGFSSDLQRFLSGGSIVAKPMGRMRKSARWLYRRKQFSIAAAAIGMALLTFAILALELRRRDHLKLEKDYKTFDTALNWSDMGRASGPVTRLKDAVPNDPCGFLLGAICHMGLKEYEKAVSEINICIQKCVMKGKSLLQDDALYLSGVLKLRLADMTDDMEERKRLISEAESELEEAGGWGFFDPPPLIWREKGRYAVRAGVDKWYLKPIKLYSDHFLVHLVLGLDYFGDLYKGGSQVGYKNALSHFDNVLNIHPDDPIVLTFQARVEYFFVRFFNNLHHLGQVRERLNRAVKAEGDTPYYLTYITLGQVSLLGGEIDQAVKHFKYAIEMCDSDQGRYLHNAYRGLGESYARKGMIDQAWNYLMKAFDNRCVDAKTNAALAELYLRRQDYSKAMEHAEYAVYPLRSYNKEQYRKDMTESGIASAYLISARVNLALQRYSAAIDDLSKISPKESAHCPRDLGLASMLLPTIPEEAIKGEKQKLQILSMAHSMALDSGFPFEDSYSPDIPIHYSSSGIFRYLNGEYGAAIDDFNEAVKCRDIWPEDVRSYHWPDDARDFYYIAMSYFKLAQVDPDQMKRADEYLQRAEDLYDRSDKNVRYIDILERIRNMAREMLKRKG